MKITIVGATGMLGQALCREGGGRNNAMSGIARSNTDFSLNLTESDRLEQVLSEIMPDIVINAAAITSLAACTQNPCEAYLVNARSVAVMANFCKSHGSYFIHISTDHYFSGDEDRKHDEPSEVTLVNEYAVSKYAGEAFALTCPGTLVVRTNIVGFRQRGHQTFVEWVIQSLENRESITLFDDFYTSSIHVDSFARALFDLIPTRPSGILNLAAKDVSSKKQFIELLAESLDLSTVNSVSGSVASLTDARRANSLGLDVSKAEKLLGYELPTTIEVVTALAAEYRRRKL